MHRILHLLIIVGALRLHCALAQTATPTVVMTDVAAARFLDQATWGPTPAAIAQLQQQGIANWLQWQFALNTSDLPDQPLIDAATGKANRNLAPVQAAFFQNALTGQDQLRQRVAFALSEQWVVSAVSTREAYAFPPYWRLFRDSAFGNYRDIIKALTLSPAMGNYLNMANNNKGNPVTGTAANENYARKLMQLFTIGLVQLNPDGSAVVDSNQNPIPTYTQAQVTDLAKALTGWTYPTAPDAKAKADNPAYYFGQMFAVEANHDTSAKTIVGGAAIPAGQTAGQDLTSVHRRFNAAAQHRPFRQPAIDSTSGDQRAHSCICGTRLECVSEQWLRRQRRYESGDRRNSYGPRSAGRRFRQRHAEPELWPSAGTRALHG